MQVERERWQHLESGVRVRNAYTTCLLHGDSLAKARLIPDGTIERHRLVVKAEAVTEGYASH
jgi:hypothetical protein